jgi:hypothetical protein
MKVMQRKGRSHEMLKLVTKGNKKNRSGGAAIKNRKLLS